MTVKCRCGGRYRRFDIAPVVITGKTYYQDTDHEKANWKCDNCGEIRTQRKRQSARNRVK